MGRVDRAPAHTMGSIISRSDLQGCAREFLRMFQECYFPRIVLHACTMRIFLYLIGDCQNLILSASYFGNLII